MQSRLGADGDWLLVALMIAAAVGLAIYAGTDWKRAAAPAAAALGGAALTRSVDIVRERRNDAERARTQEAEGIDECRRLMRSITAPSIINGSHVFTAATVVNALLHHHRSLLSDEDVAVLEDWEAHGYGPPTMFEVGAAFNRIYERMAVRERELKQ